MADSKGIGAYMLLLCSSESDVVLRPAVVLVVAVLRTVVVVVQTGKNHQALNSPHLNAMPTVERADRV